MIIIKSLLIHKFLKDDRKERRQQKLTISRSNF